MHKILHYLFLIRFRKLVSKGDILAIILILLLHIAAAFVVYVNYEVFRNYIFIAFLEVVIYHLQRTDLELLKLKKNYKTVVFVEYCIYSLPFYLVLVLKKEFWFIMAILVFKIVLINVPKFDSKIIRYPFDLFNVFWHVSFRKYRLIYIYPILLFLIYAAIRYSNENLTFMIFIAFSLLACIPTFEKESVEELKSNPFNGEKYLLHQLKNTIINTFYLVIVIVPLLCILQWEKLVFLPLVFIAPFLNVLLRYIYFNNHFLQQIVFTFFLASAIFFYGIPLIILPFLYKKAVNTLNTLKTC